MRVRVLITYSQSTISRSMLKKKKHHDIQNPTFIFQDMSYYKSRKRLVFQNTKCNLYSERNKDLMSPNLLTHDLNSLQLMHAHLCTDLNEI